MSYAASSSGASHSRFTPSKGPFTPSRVGSLQDLAPKAKFNSLVIRGRINSGANEVRLRIYAKISVPAGQPQHTFSMFPENGTTLRTSFIHPLDASGTPYAYPKIPAKDPASSLLRNAIRALNPPKPLQDQYIDVLDQQRDLPDALRAMARLGGDREGLSKAVLGSVTVVNYMTTFITPKFPMPTPSAMDVGSPSVRTPGRKSLSARAVANYMIGMEITAPISGGSADSPFMLVLPIPECLDNRIKLYLPPSPEKGREWVTMPTPRVLPNTRNPLISRGASSESADDEADPIGGETIEGTFQCDSSQTFVLRWSSWSGPASDEPQRQLVSINKVTSDASYVVHPMEMEEQRQVDGDSTIRVQKYVPVDLEWRGTCTGLSHPGVETSLAVEILLDGRRKGMEVEWGNTTSEAHGRVPTGSWGISGGIGFNGFDRVASEDSQDAHSRSRSRRREMSSSPTPSAPYTGSIHGATSRHPTQLSEDSSPNTSLRVYSGSLLRTPLPGLDVDEYSFETAHTEPEDHSPVTPGRRTTSSGALSRESSGPSASSVLTPSSSAIGRISTSQALGASSGSEASLAVSTPMSMSDFTGTSASPRRPRSLSHAAHSTPCDPIHVRLNLMHLIQQGGFDPQTASMDFALKARLNILVPEGMDEKDVTLPLPIIRLPRAKEHHCEFNIQSYGTNPIDVFTPGNKTTQVFPGDAFESGVTPVSPSLLPRDSSAAGMSIRVRNIRIPEVVSSNLTVHDAEPLALVMPSPHGSFDVTPTAPHRQRAVDFNRSSISCVEVTATPLPPSLGAPLAPRNPVHWTQLVVIKAPWPCAADSSDFLPSVEFGFPKSMQGVLAVRSAHVGGRIAPFRVFSQLLSSGGRMPTILEKQDEGEWGYWVKVNLPADLEKSGGEMQFVYSMSQEVTSRRSAELVMVVPGFNVDVAVLRLAVESLEGFNLKVIQGDIAVRDANAGTFGTASVARRTPRFLKYSLSRPIFDKAASKWLSRASKATLFLAIAFVLFDQQSMRAELGLAPSTHRLAQVLQRRPTPSVSYQHLPTSTVTPIPATTSYRPPVETIPGAPEDMWDDLWNDARTQTPPPAPYPTSTDSHSSSTSLVKPAMDVYNWFSMPGVLGLAKGEYRDRVLYITKIWLWKVVQVLNAIWNYPS